MATKLRMKRFAVISALLFIPYSLFSQSFVVMNTNDDTNPGSLRSAIIQANASPGSSITFSPSIAGSTIHLNYDLPAITTNMTIDGGTNMIKIFGSNGGSISSRIFFVYSGAVAINNLSLENSEALGGSGGATSGGAGGGGGGLGAGGAIFINNLATVSMTNVNFINNNAHGGFGGNSIAGTLNYAGGGGGGLVGSGALGDPSSPTPQPYGGDGGGGGGAYYIACPTCTVSSQLNGVAGMAAPSGEMGGSGGQGGPNGGTGGTATSITCTGCLGGNATSGNSPSAPTDGKGGGGGGGGSSINFTDCGGCGPLNPDTSGGSGGDGGAAGDFAGAGGAGAGGGNSDGAFTSGLGGSGGLGGYGGGGGGAGSSNISPSGGGAGGNGGFGAGGGGGAGNGIGTSLFAGGNGGAGGSSPGGGGGGAGLGGAMFIRSGGSLTIGGAVILTANHAVGGAGGVPAGPTAGLGLGDDIFLSSGSTLTFRLTSSLTISSNIEADNLGPTNGGLFIDNAPSAALILTGTNTYTGGTTINSGILQVSGDGSLGNTSYTIVTMGGGTLQAGAPITTINNRTLNITSPSVFDTQGNSMTFNMAVNGGSFTKIGSGTLTLVGINGYTGTATISNGTLALAAISTIQPTSSISIGATGVFDISVVNPAAVTIANFSGQAGSLVHLGPATLTFGTDVDTTFAGDIDGSGGLIKQGSGTFTMPASSINSYMGDTMINAGTLILDGKIASSNVTVAPAATLEGGGTVNSLTNNGTVEPLGTLTVNGNYTQASTASLISEIFPNGTSNLLSIGGTASLDGSLNVIATPGSYPTSYTYTIVQAAGGRSGTFFPTKVDSLQPGLQITGVVYTGTQVQITTLNTRTYLGPTVPQFNPAQVEIYLGNLTYYANASLIPSQADLFSIFLDLSTLDPAELESALDQLHPALFGAFEIVNSNIRTFIASILNYQPREFCCHQLEYCLPCGNVSIWADPFAFYLNQNRVYDMKGFTSAMGGGVIGFQGEFAHHILVGVAAGGSGSSIKWKESAGHGVMNSAFICLYGNWRPPCGYIEFSALGGLDFLRAHRNIQFPGVDRVASNKHRAKDLALHFGTGLLHERKGVLFEPFLDIDYSNLNQDAYKEYGAQSLDLHVKAKHEQMIRFQEGICFSHVFDVGSGCLAPTLSLSYVSEFPILRTHYKSLLVGQEEPGSSDGEWATFNSRSFGKVSNRFAPSIDFSWKGNSCYSFSIRYTAEIGKYLNLQKGDARFKYEF